MFVPMYIRVLSEWIDVQIVVVIEGLILTTESHPGLCVCLCLCLCACVCVSLSVTVIREQEGVTGKSDGQLSSPEISMS